MTTPAWAPLKCKECGHNFYDDQPVRNGLCKWCIEEGEGNDDSTSMGTAAAYSASCKDA
jgi:hypothetical protein